ncbi:uncharacterized protein ACA1_385110 [Acanthamoeba castellanii str. Neff]|uniref:Methyltransferase type 11 domain-containing protein n=1 Tax=Acanthamoeba castellanii (strain ATCC 30010 / Neff) TaxID=1257118 RepID=L8H9A0_ACACF|nr:uncharacterized protein ACA1_385110 [Acanthamoeba castellanii str. Neff]ELR21755.1 hypothetical protein ACA1_385110 [Acanthamoeba castellanii str. Neff]
MCVEAARRYKARCVGIELDDALVKEARLNAQRGGLDDRITILKQNALEVDYTDASVVTMYLSEHGNKKMKQVLSRCLKPGARVVTYQFPGTSPSHTHDTHSPSIFTTASNGDDGDDGGRQVAGWLPDKVHNLASGQRLFLFHHPPKTSNNDNNNENS